MQWIETDSNNIITAIKAAQQAPEGATVLPSDHQCIKGTTTAYYDANWQMKSLQSLVDEGVITLAEDEKIEGGQIVKKDRVFYLFSTETGELTDTIRLHPDAVEESGILDREDVTEEEPPETGENETAVFGRAVGTWSVQTDYRGYKYWYKKTGKRVQFQIGDEPDDTMIDIEPGDFESVWNGSGWEVPTKVKAERARNERNGLLKECDYIMMPDYPLNNKEVWKIYRQALRDLTETSGFPNNIIWPVKPDIIKASYVNYP
jgi:hypothetical protein